MSQTFHDHFSGVANRYADFRPHYPAELFDYLATLAPRNSVVWDCACGNGQATLDLGERFARIVATDASKEQIASATARVNVEYRTAPAETSGLDNESVNLITVAQALHWFDLARFYGEVRRVFRPGGVLAVWAYGIDEVEGDSVNSLVQDFYFNIVGPYWPPERKLVEEGYRTIPFPFTEIQAPQFRMEARWTLEQLLGYIGTWSATSRFIQATGRNPVVPLAEGLSRTVVWPLSVRIGKKD